MLKFDSEEKDDEQTEQFRDRDAEEIVRRLEAKYGTQTLSMSTSTTSVASGLGTKKAKKRKKGLKFAVEDVIDKGLGYVQEDDFIDDSEPYDEWVPTTMDTAKRGHYVNMGPLEFRHLDEDASTCASTSNENETGSSQSEEGEKSSSSSENEMREEDLAHSQEGDAVAAKKTTKSRKKDNAPRISEKADSTQTVKNDTRTIH